MSGDEPQPSNNPFIRFKRHVDSRIGSGLSLLTGAPSRPDTAATTTGAISAALPPPSQLNPQENMDRAPQSPPSIVGIDSLLGRRHKALGVQGETRQYWNEWTQLSTYSPYNLRHLPQPVPAGASSEDAKLFDFEDALEDLLAVSSGRELMDLRKQADHKRRILDTFHFGEPPLLWVNRLSARRLLPEPLPPRHSLERRLELADTDAQLALHSQILNGIEAQKQYDRESMEKRRRALDDIWPKPKEESQEWGSLKEKMLKGLDKDITFNPAKMLRHAEEMVKNIDNMAASPTSFLDSFNFDKFCHDVEQENVQTAQQQKAQGHQKPPQPDTEQDLFSTIFGALTEMDKSLSAKFTAESPHRNEVRRQKKPREREEVVEHDENGGKTLKKWSEHVDMFGNVHEQTEVRQLDADGNQIRCETKLVIRSTANEVREPESTASGFQDENNKVPAGNNSKSTGWFWR